MTPSIVAIVGPTASGKTALSLILAELLGGEIVSADSRQIYKYLDIGTAKPTLQERERIRHHFIDILEPTEDFSAGAYGEQAREVIREILKRGKIPVLVGGSGLYVKSALDGLFDGPGKEPEIRQRLEEQFQREGIHGLLERLKEVDPSAVAKMKEITPRRVIRALEVYSITGTTLSEFHTRKGDPAGFVALQFGLRWDRKELYGRIDERVNRMIAAGLLEEVRRLDERGFSRRLNALNTVGYKEAFDHLEGLIDRATMIDLIKRNSRRFAKRQMTWFGSDSRIQWLEMTKNAELRTVALMIADQSYGTTGRR